jgi:hypothetical protein
MHLHPILLPILLALFPLAAWAQPAGDTPTATLGAYFETTRAAEHVSELIPYLPAEIVEFLEARMHTDVEEAAAWLADLQTRVPADPAFLEEVIHGDEAIVSYNYSADGQQMGGLWILLREGDAWKVLVE